MRNYRDRLRFLVLVGVGLVATELRTIDAWNRPQEGSATAWAALYALFRTTLSRSAVRVGWQRRQGVQLGLVQGDVGRGGVSGDLRCSFSANDDRGDRRAGEQPGQRHLVRLQAPLLAQSLDSTADLQLEAGEAGTTESLVTGVLPFLDLHAGQQPAMQRTKRHHRQPELPGRAKLAFDGTVDQVVLDLRADRRSGQMASSAIHSAWTTCHAGWLGQGHVAQLSLPHQIVI